MVTYAMYVARFPEFASTSQPRFDIFAGDAVLEMGGDETRWLDWYDVAQANLIAHNLTVASYSLGGDATPMKPIRSSDVDDVLVEFATAKEYDARPLDVYDDTIYGQQYLKWRNMAFAGARVVF